VLSFLQGTLQECSPQHVIVEAMGLGFYIHIPASFYFQMPPPGNPVTIHTFLQIRDDKLILYGFRSNDERNFFKMLLNVSGIGPKIALALLGHLSLAEVASAIAQEDMSTLTSIPGIGPKTARRLIYELKEKLAGWQLEAVSGTEGIITDHWQDVQQALTALGYSSQEINRAKKNLRIEEHLNVEELFKKVLFFLAKH
jgi:Holliday junction DNA helicase RuvA